MYFPFPFFSHFSSSSSARSMTGAAREVVHSKIVLLKLAIGNCTAYFTSKRHRGDLPSLCALRPALHSSPPHDAWEVVLVWSTSVFLFLLMRKLIMIMMMMTTTTMIMMIKMMTMMMMMMIIPLKGAIRFFFFFFYNLFTAPRTVSSMYAQVARAQS